MAHGFKCPGLDSWWYGVPLLVRGPLLSLPIVLATDYPPMQTVFVNLILSVFLLIETLSWPWKVPLLNIMDMWLSLCLMLLVMGSALYLDSVEGVMAQFASAFSTVACKHAMCTLPAQYQHNHSRTCSYNMDSNYIQCGPKISIS